MRKTLLLLSASLLAAGFANGQSAVKKNLAVRNADVTPVAGSSHARTGTCIPARPATFPATTGNTAGHKGTVGGGARWYDYVGRILEPNVTAIAVTGQDIWYDTSSIWGYTGTTSPYAENRMTSIGLGFDPMYSAWNDPVNFPGEPAVSALDPYTIDSAFVGAWYNRNYTKPGVSGYVDTLILTFVYGTGDTLTNLHGYSFSGPGALTLLGYYSIPSSGALNFIDMLFDSSRHRAGAISSSTVIPVTSTSALYKFLLYPSDTNNSDFTSGTQYPRYSRPTGAPADPVINFAVPAGNYASMSVTFRTGDPTYPAFPMHDTVRMSSGTAITGFKYGGYRPTIAYAATASTGGSASFPPYNPADHTSGYFKREGDAGWGGLYSPNWAWSASGSASVLQYPYISYHINCSSCALTGSPSLAISDVTDLNNIIVAPNPADNSLNVSFPLATGSKATISLTNMIGQVVLQQATTTGRSAISTASLPAGMYVLTIESGGARTTHRVVVAH